MTKSEKYRQETGKYASAGVHLDAGNKLIDLIRPIARTTARSGAEAKIGSFGGIFDLKKTGFTDPLLVAANDGVGTKVKIAAESKIHSTIGVDLVAMCVNDLIVHGAEPLFFLDYYATGYLETTVATEIIKGVAKGCQEAGCALIGGETAEMPGIYQRKEYDLAGFAVGAVERHRLLPQKELTRGDLLLGLASSGLHSNGFSLVRKLITESGLKWNDPAPFMTSQSLAQSILTPTRIYVKSLLTALRAYSSIKALVHVTGGGFEENIPRVLTNELTAWIDLSQIRPQPVFHWLARKGKITQEEMLNTFNCGIGMILIIAKEEKEKIITTLTQAGEEVFTLGALIERKGQTQIRFTENLSL
ncbi:MAG: phosphoribosylformylglycinamidine cyclo-ligase [Alphaproteobacteria bacterium]|nr:phosphoribosylformylglycinamidine cyclo-ligase [Alphaproteobacteria bacterium]